MRKHNEEMDKRADRAAEKVKDEDLEKDKVGKGFWTGEQSGEFAWRGVWRYGFE